MRRLQSQDAAQPVPATTGSTSAIPDPGRRAWFVRLLALTGSLVAMGLVFRRLDLPELVEALSRIRPGYYVAAILLFGLGLIPSGFRWHQMLRLNRCEVTGATSVRMVFLSHFFSTVLLGPSSGDIPKTALYCRWFGFRGPDVLAASMLDRLVAGVSGVLFILAALAVAASTGGMDFFGRIQWKALPANTVILLAVGLAVSGAVFLWVKRRSPASFAGRTFHSLGRSIRALWGCRATTARALVCSLLVVGLLTAAQVLCVLAASHDRVSWLNLFWGLHLATMIASLPITVAGIGLREGAYISFLGLYGVTAPEAVAAALLTLSLHVIWAIAGLALWIQEQRLRAQYPGPAVKSNVVVVGGGAGTVRSVEATRIQGDRILVIPAPACVASYDTLAAVERCSMDPTIVGGAVWPGGGAGQPLDILKRFRAWIGLWGMGVFPPGCPLYVRESVLEQADRLEVLSGSPAAMTSLGPALRARGRLALIVASGNREPALKPGDVGLDPIDVRIPS